jgi:hypothetical protein
MPGAATKNAALPAAAIPLRIPAFSSNRFHR